MPVVGNVDMAYDKSQPVPVPGTMPRLMVGPATGLSSENTIGPAVAGIDPQTASEYLAALVSFPQNSQAVIEAIGNLIALTLGNQASQWGGGLLSGAQPALAIVSLSDSANANVTPAYIEGRVAAVSAGGMVALEIDIANAGPASVSTPANPSASGLAKIPLWLAAGAAAGAPYTNNLSAFIGLSNNGVRADKAIVVGSNALNTNVGSGGAGTFADLFSGQGMRWLDALDAVKAEIWGASDGLHVSPGIISGGAALGLPILMANLNAAQSVSSGVFATVLFDTIIEDSGPYYNAGTGRFTPLVAGTYQVDCTICAFANAWTAGNSFQIALQKNGGATNYALPIQYTPAVAGTFQISAQALVELNGSTDFVSVAASITGAAPVVAGSHQTSIAITRVG